MIFVLIVLFTSLQNKEIKILIKSFQNSKIVHLQVIFLMRKALIKLGSTSIPNLSRKTSKWRFRFSTLTQPWKHQLWPNIFFWLKNILHWYHRKQNNCKRPTCYTMITLFDQERKYYNQNKKYVSPRFTYGTPNLLQWLVRWKLWIQFQEVLISMHNF